MPFFSINDIFIIAFKSEKEREITIIAKVKKSDNYMGSNREKKPWTNLQKNRTVTEVKTDNFCYRKIVKINILIVYKNIIMYFGGTNNILSTMFPVLLFEIA